MNTVLPSHTTQTDRATESLSSYTPGSVQTLRYPDGSLGLIQIDAAESPVLAGDEGQETIVDDASSDAIAGTLPPNAQILNVSSIQQVCSAIHAFALRRRNSSHGRSFPLTITLDNRLADLRVGYRHRQNDPKYLTL